MKDVDMSQESPLQKVDRDLKDVGKTAVWMSESSVLDQGDSQCKGPRHNSYSRQTSVAGA